MNKSATALLRCFQSFAICGGAICLLAISFAVQSRNQQPEREDPWEQIDSKAKAAQSGDERAIRELADAVFRSPSSLGVMPSEMIPDAVKERLICSEIGYRTSKHKGVAEERVVRVVDEAARLLEAPAYALSSQEEVRLLRLLISHSMPNFIPHQPQSGLTDTDGPAFAVHSMMSPLEAVYVTRAVFEQKEINEAFLLTPLERANVKSSLRMLKDQYQLTPLEVLFVTSDIVHQEIDKVPQESDVIVASVRRRIAEWAGQIPAFVMRQAEVTQPGNTVITARPSSPRLNEMKEVMHRASRMSTIDGYRLLIRMLDELGIDP